MSVLPNHRADPMPPQALPDPPSVGAALWLHAELHLRRTLRLKQLWPGLLLVALVAAAAVGVARASAGEPRALLAFVGSLGVRAIGLIALGFGTRALRADADHGALSAFLLRPRAATALPLGRFVATSCVVAAYGVALVAAVQLAALGFALPIPWGHLPFLLVAIVLAAAGYTALFMLLAAVARPAAALGLAWLVLVDLGLGGLSSRIGLLSPGPTAGVVMGADTDVALFSADALDVWLNAGASVMVTCICVALMTARFRGDAPE